MFRTFVCNRVFTLGFLLAEAATAQQYIISTVAGGAPPQTPVQGVVLSIQYALGVATDSSGNVYFSSSANCVYRLDKNGVATRIAGNSRAGYSGDGGSATDAQLYSSAGLAVDGAGNLFIADSGRIRRVSAGGIITTVAGGGKDSPGDNGPATGAQLGGIIGVAVDATDNLFIADSSRIRKVSPDGIITTVAGNGTQGYSGDGGPAIRAELNNPAGMAIDAAGNLYIADAYNLRVRVVSTDGTITTVAGNGTYGVSGDGAQATGAQLSYPEGVAVDGAGNLFIAESTRIRKISTGGIITTVAGGGQDFAGDGGPATNAQIEPFGVAVDGAGNLFVADFSRIRKVSPDGIITTVAGTGKSGVSGDGVAATSARFVGPFSVAVDDADNLFFSDSLPDCGGFDSDQHVRKVSPGGIITTVAGTGIRGFSGDGGPATNAQLNGPAGVVVDGAANLFIADFLNARVRRVSPDGTITTVAGNGSFGTSGDGGPATSAPMYYPVGVAVDGAGNLFIAGNFYDSGQGQVRKVSPSGIITTVAGGNGTGGFSGDGGPAASAGLRIPEGVAVDGAGNLFIADSYNSRIRKVSPDGIITTVAGTGKSGFSGDGGPATSAQLSYPEGLAVDAGGNLFIADSLNNRVRVVSSDGTIATVAGNGVNGYSGDGGPATGAQLNYTTGVAVDRAGNVYVADPFNQAVRVLRPTNQSVLIGSVLDAASESANPISPGKIVVIYGAGLGPAQLVQNQASNGQFGTSVGGTVVSFNGIAAPILYASATAVAAIVPYAISGTTAQVTVTYQGQASPALAIPVAPSAPSLFTANETGAGQAVAINTMDGTVNTAANPVRIGDSVSLYATGEGQTAPDGVDGTLGGSMSTQPLLPVSVTVGGIKATVQSKGGVQGQVAGLMQVNVLIPNGVHAGGYVPVVLQVGDASTTPGAVWIAVSGS